MIIKKYLLTFAACITPLASPLCASENATNNLPEVAQRYDDILRLKLQSKAHPGELSIHSQAYEVDTAFGALRLTPQQQFVAATTAMRDHDNAQTLGQNTVFTVDAWQSLRLFTEHPALVHAIAPETATIFGKSYLTRLLTSPTTDSKRIYNRQSVVKTFINNPELLAHVRTLCTKISSLQEHILSLQSPLHPIYEKSLQMYFHKRLVRDAAPRSKTWNLISKWFDDIWYLVGPFLYSLPLAMPWVFAFNESLPAKNEVRAPKSLWEKMRNAPEFFAEKILALTKNSDGSNYKKKAFLTLLVAMSLYSAAHAKSIVSWMFDRWKVLNYFYSNLKPLKEWFSAIDELHAIAQSIAPLETLSDEIDLSISLDNKDFASLTKLLTSSAFSSKTNAHVMGGIITLALDKLTASRSLITKGVGLVGALDVYSSLAQWYNASQKDQHHPLCFAYLASHENTPKLNAQNFWHPAYYADAVAHNDIVLGTDKKPRNALITGIFESGKSTILSGLASAVVCAQTIGMCTAQQVQITPFSVINVYAGIKDDLANNRSLFANELYRSELLVSETAALPKDKFCFSIIDGAFTGTEDREGQSAAYSVALYLGKIPNSISLHATNFLSLSRLGTENPELFRNYYLPSHFDEAVTHSYKLTPGAENPFLASAIFKEEGIPEHMIDALEQELLTNLEKQQ